VSGDKLRVTGTSEAGVDRQLQDRDRDGAGQGRVSAEQSEVALTRGGADLQSSADRRERFGDCESRGTA
jgi:hypothetical protein